MNAAFIISIIAILEFIALIILFMPFLKKRKQNVDREAFEQIDKERDWTLALHDKFCHRWMEVFSNLDYPLDSISKKNIIALLWEISSTTIDCLMLEHNDTNLLQRHRDSVTFLVGDSKQWNNLKEFHLDPSTVPHQVIAIYDILKEVDYNGEIVAFGYKITID